MRVNRTALVAAATGLLVLGGFAAAGVASAADPLVPLATDCSATQLELHNGFQEGPRCVQTSMGEMTELDKNPQLFIVSAPDRVSSGEDFTLKVSTRNLIRDRFLAAGQGGYYLESALLGAGGLTRGHFHTGCRVVAKKGSDVKVAPIPDRSVFFQATEDGKGSAEPDVVKITVKGKDAAGKALFSRGDTVQCASWAGDGSHRTPMMQFANSIPAFDSRLIEVRW